MRDVQKAIKIVLASIEISGQVAVIDPNIDSIVQSNCITVVRIHPGYLEVSQDDIVHSTDVEPNTLKSCLAVSIV